MKTKVGVCLKEYAESLREQGFKYSEIVEKCLEVGGNSVTIDWCKRNLKGVEIKTMSALTEKECIKRITDLALRPEGVTSWEAYAVIRTITGADDDNEKVYRRIRSKVIKSNSKAFFRPASINPYKAYDSKEMLQEKALLISEYVNEKIDEYRLEIFGTDYNEFWNRSAVLNELVALSLPSLHHMGGCQARNDVLDNAVEKLEERTCY